MNEIDRTCLQQSDDRRRKAGSRKRTDGSAGGLIIAKA